MSMIAQLIEGGAFDDNLKNENWSPLARPGEQAKARARTARASTQSLAEQFAGSMVGEILYARLFCGLRFFDKNHKITREFPPCAVKQVCSIISTAKSQGRTTEEVLPEEIKLATNGLEKLLNAAPHALCFSCANRFCPIKKKIARSGSSPFRKTRETETVGDRVYQYAPKPEESAAA
jgi:hypothetical protein